MKPFLRLVNPTGEIFMRFLLSGLLAMSLFLGWAAEKPVKQPAQTPEMMTKMVVRVIGPGITPRSFAALPKTIYAAGPHYARIEAPPDARQGLQKLTIIAEPDAYSVNLIDKKGTHAIDQGGANDLHLPIVLAFDPKHTLPTLDRLEFGKEFEFFEESGAAKIAGPIINAKVTDAYRLTTGHSSATLVLKAGTHVPIRVTWQGDDGVYTYEYITYEETAFNAELFARPAGIAFKEILPDPTAPKS